MFKKKNRQIQLIDIFNDLEREDHIRERIEKQLGQKNDMPFTGLNTGFGGSSSVFASSGPSFSTSW